MSEPMQLPRARSVIGLVIKVVVGFGLLIFGLQLLLGVGLFILASTQLKPVPMSWPPVKHKEHKERVVIPDAPRIKT